MNKLGVHLNNTMHAGVACMDGIPMVKRHICSSSWTGKSLRYDDSLTRKVTRVLNLCVYASIEGLHWLDC
jgi:hypothetical protein